MGSLIGKALLLSTLVGSVQASAQPQPLVKIVAVQQAEIKLLKQRLDAIEKMSASGQLGAMHDVFYKLFDGKRFTNWGTFLLTVTTRSSSVPGRGKVATFAISTHSAFRTMGSVVSVSGVDTAGSADFVGPDVISPTPNNITVKVVYENGTWVLYAGHEQANEEQLMAYSLSAFSG